MKNEAIVLIDPAGSAIPFKASARELGLHVIAVFAHPLKSFETFFHSTPEMLIEDCDEVIISGDKDEILKKLQASKFAIKGVIGASEGGVEMADQIAHELHLWGNSIELSHAKRDKGEMRKVVRKSGLSCPDFAICHSEEEVIRFAESHSFPIMAKTPMGVGTSQVYQCLDLEELLESFRKIYHTENTFGDSAESVVVEEYISGIEYIVDTFSDGDKVHATDVWKYEKINTDTYKNIYYSIISIPLFSPDVQEIIKYALRIAEVFRIQRGSAHIELKDDPVRGPTLIEIGARLGGASIPPFLRKYTNFDVYKANLEVFTKGKTRVPKQISLKKHLVIVLCPALEGGKIQKFLGLEKIQCLKSYDGHMLRQRVGDTISPSTHLGSIPLFVFLANENQAQLLTDLEATHELFSIEFEKKR